MVTVDRINLTNSQCGTAFQQILRYMRNTDSKGESYVTLRDGTRKDVFREYKSFGVSPPYDNTTGKAYMYNMRQPEVPDILKRLKNTLGLGAKYNNYYVNYYKDGSKYIEQHSDCTKHLDEDSDIVILTLYPESKPYYGYELLFTHKEFDKSAGLRIPLMQGSVVSMPLSTQKTHRHGTEPNDIETSPRISVVFRAVKKVNEV